MARARPGVLIIGPTPPPFHGVAVAMQSLLRAGCGERLTLWHLDIADRRGIAHVENPDLHDVWQFARQWLTLAWLLARRRPQVVYLAISQSTLGFVRDALFMALAYAARRKVVIHLHGGAFAQWYGGRGTLLRRLVRAALSRCSRFIVLAEAFRGPLSDLVPPERIAVVPNGIACPDVSRERPPLPRPRYRVLFLSTLSRNKGALLLLEAAAAIARERDDVEFVLAGPWFRDADRVLAGELIARHGLAPCVSFTGEVAASEKARLFAAADVFVFPGIQQEGQPLVVLEAMAAGLPVVFADRGCLAETVGDGVAGLCFTPGDAAALAQRLLWLLQRPQEMQRLAHNARARYEACYSEPRFISNMTRVFLEAAGASA